MTQAFTVYKNLRIYYPAEQEFARDQAGRFIVHAAIAELNSEVICRVPIDGCVVMNYQLAAKLSMEESMRLINDGFRPFYGTK